MKYSITHTDILSAKRLDAEYFQYKFLNLQKKLEKKTHVRLHEVCEFIQTGPAGSVLPASSYTSSGTKVYRPLNLNGWTCDNGELVYVDKLYNIKLYRKSDILATRIGDTKFGIIEGDDLSAISPNLTAIRTRKNLLDPYYLLAFLNTQFGYNQIRRGVKRASLSSVGIDQIAKMLIPCIPFEEQKKISDLVRRGLERRKQAKSLYVNAENILLDNLYKKIASLHPSLAMTNIHLNNCRINFLKLRATKRADAEYFINKQSGELDNIKTIELGEIARVFRGVETGRKNYQKNGKLYLRTSNISKYGLVNKSQKYISDDVYEKYKEKYQPKVGEVLLVKDGKPGTACIVNKPIAGIISGGIVRLWLSKIIPIEYVFLCLNSPFCGRQIISNTDGSLVPHWKVEQIKRLRIPLVQKKAQSEIMKLIKKSVTDFQTAEEDLNSAIKGAKCIN